MQEKSYGVVSQMMKSLKMILPNKGGNYLKKSDEVSTTGAKKGTASEEAPIVSTAEGKAIMIEEEPKKKSKKELEQKRLSYAEAIRIERATPMIEEQRVVARVKRLQQEMGRRGKT
ncbi:hypothetical protein Tco_0920260 [Tanacetum coccineum]